jgi:methylenetetrahydrofolate reductase (NADPH)
MRIVDMLSRPRFFSFEFFPPKSEADETRLMQTLRDQLEPLGPSFVSVTYGAGGSTQRTSVALAKRIKHETGLEVLAHVTGTGRTRDEMRALFDDLAAAGVENVLALRGDPPRDGAPRTTDSPFTYATDLIALLASEYDFCIGAACYPETHPEAISQTMDVAYAAEKVRLGAHFLITQLFFDNAAYFTFVQRAHALGITAPIVPGIMPITNANQVRRFTSMCGASIPPALQAALDARADEPDAVPDLGVAYASLQCADLLARGAPGLHFYTLNRSPATRAVVSALVASGLWPALSREPVATA